MEQSFFTFISNNFYLILIAGVGVTFLGVVFALVFAYYESKKPTKDKDQEKAIKDLTSGIKKVEKNVGDCNSHISLMENRLESRIREIEKDYRGLKDDLERLRDEMNYLQNMERMNASGAFKVHPNEPPPQHASSKGSWNTQEQTHVFAEPKSATQQESVNETEKTKGFWDRILSTFKKPPKLPDIGFWKRRK